MKWRTTNRRHTGVPVCRTAWPVPIIFFSLQLTGFFFFFFFLSFSLFLISMQLRTDRFFFQVSYGTRKCCCEKAAQDPGLWTTCYPLKSQNQDQQIQGPFPAKSCQTAQLLAVIPVHFAIQDEAPLCVCVCECTCVRAWMRVCFRTPVVCLCVCVYWCVAVWGGGEKKEARALPCVHVNKLGNGQ